MNKDLTIITILIGLSIGIGAYRCMIHYNKDNPSLTNIIDLEQARNNIKQLLNIQKEYMLKYNYNYNFYRG